MTPSLAVLAVLAPLFLARPSQAQSDRSPLEMAYDMGRSLLDAGDPPGIESPRDAARRADRALAGRLASARQPLSPEDLGTSTVVLIGDMPYEAQGRAWLRASVGALRAGGATHVGFELLRADQQDVLDAYLDGRTTRGEALRALLGEEAGARFPRARRQAFSETLSVAEAAASAGLGVVCLGLPEALEDLAFEQLTGKSRAAVRRTDPLLYRHLRTETAPVFDRLQSDDLAARVTLFLQDRPGARLVALASPGRLSRGGSAGRLALAGIETRTYGFFFPDSWDLNDSLVRVAPAVRYPDYWAWIQRPEGSDLDGLLLAPASLFPSGAGASR